MEKHLDAGSLYIVMFVADQFKGCHNIYYRIGCVSTRFGLLHALAYYAQHNCDFIMTIIMRSGLLRAFGL